MEDASCVIAFKVTIIAVRDIEVVAPFEIWWLSVRSKSQPETSAQA
jgi:hypothetical protein